MSEEAQSLSSGKGHRDENFPVASLLIRRRYRPAILAFYRFARTADDVADHPTLGAQRKLALLDDMRRTLRGEADVSAEAAALRRVSVERNLSGQHALDLLEAFTRDVTKLRYADWDDLMDYCRYSAMPVGRFVLDVHGEPEGTWPASDALCAALQVINHLQDCGRDYRTLGRVYIPRGSLLSAGTTVEALKADKASPALKSVIDSLANRTSALLVKAKSLADQIGDFRLALEVGVIQKLAEDLVKRLLTGDPLSERVHHRKSESIIVALKATASFLAHRPRSRATRMKLVSSRP
ncbi:MAG: squalene synthase HpnC [Rhizomicrobium sp.]|jgi:squalene synthase HpnC